MTKKYLISILALGAVALGVGSSVIVLGAKADDAHAATSYSIGTLAELNTFFDGVGTNCGNSATLTADIDLNGAYVAGMAGEFAGTFDGAGHRLYNGAVGANKSLFNIIGTAGVVKNLTLDVTITGAVVRPVSYQNNGTIQDCTAILRTGAASVNNVAAFAYLAGSGTYTNLATHWVVDHAGADWLCTIYRDQSSTNITNCIYTMNGSVASSADFQADSATQKTGVVYVTPVPTQTVAVGASLDISPEFFANSVNSLALTSADSAVATATYASGVVTISGVGAGSTTLTGTVTNADASTYVFTIPVTVVSAAPVTAVALDKSTASVYASKTVSLTATLTGTEYTSISWASDAESYATVVGNGVSATVTGVAAGSANVMVTVVSTSGTYTASCAITVNPSVYVRVYMLESKNTEAKTTYWDQAWISPYGELTSGLVKMTKAQVNGIDVELRIANPTHNSAVDSWKVWYYDLDVTGKTMTWTNAWVQFSSGVGLWGAGYQITSADGNVAMLGYTGAANPADAGVSPAECEAAMGYLSGTLYGTSWRTSDSICYLLDGSHNTRLTEVITGYDALTADQKKVASYAIDDTTAYTATYGETIAMLKSKATLTDGVYKPNAAVNPTVAFFGTTGSSDSTGLIVICALLGVTLLGAGYFIYKRKRA